MILIYTVLGRLLWNCNRLETDIINIRGLARIVRVLSLWSGVNYGFVTEPWHSCHVLFLCECAGFECARALRSLVCVPCFVLERGVQIPVFRRVLCCCTQFVFYRLRAFMLCLVLCGTQLVYFIDYVLSCLVWTHGLWVFPLAACSCPVLHNGWWFVCWPCACVFVLCEHIALS